MWKNQFIIGIKKLIPAYIKIKSLYTIQQEKILDNELTFLFGLIDNDKHYEATKELHKLKEKYVDLVPELSKASAMLSFLNVNYVLNVKYEEV